MGERRKHLKLSFIWVLVPLAGLLTFSALTNPVDSVSHSLIFFSLLLAVIAATVAFITYLFMGRVSPKSRWRIVTISIAAVVALMLKSSGSLKPAETVVLLLIVVGLWFYSGRRAQ